MTSPHGYLVALFDILGFEQKLKEIGLKEMLSRYEALIEVVNYRKKQVKQVFGDFGFSEAPHWSSDGDIFIFNEIHGAYASDSILLWTNRTWPEARGKTVEECKSHLSDPANAWAFQPIPCDNFLDVCNDIMCRSIEVGLPLRGAVSVGEAIFDGSRDIFLGQPIVDAAHLEKGQQFIGTSFCSSAINQIIPKRYLLQFDRHIKDGYEKNWSGLVLDWPRHWRKTRSLDLSKIILGMDTSINHSAYYKNTLDCISFSQKFADQFEGIKETSIRSVYKAFTWSNEQLSVRARPVRRVLIDPNS